MPNHLAATANEVFLIRAFTTAAVLFAAAGLGLLAPTGASGKTIYSLNSLGDPVRRINVRSLGMGGAGLALADGYNLSMGNPALLGSVPFPGMSSRFMVQRRSVKATDGASHAMSDGDFGALRVALPIRGGTVVGFGLEPITDMDFGLTDSVATGPEPYRLTITGSGGVQAISLGLGQRLGDLYLGARLDMVVLGTVSETWKRDFASEVYEDADRRGTVDYLDTSDHFVRTFRGYVPAFGAVYQPAQKWYVGMTLQPRRSIRQTETLKNAFAERGFEEGVATKSDVDLPATVGIGLAYDAGYRWKAAMDLTRSMWGGTGAGRHDTVEWAAGGLYRMGSDDPLSRSRRLEFTGGIHYRSLYFRTPRGGQVAERGLSLGVTVPLRRGGAGRFHYAIEVGTRGDTDAHGLSERYIMQVFSISGFVR